MLLLAFFLAVIAVIVGFYIYRNKHHAGQATRRRHQREPQFILQNEKTVEFNANADEALGLIRPLRSAENGQKPAKAKLNSPADFVFFHVVAPKEFPFGGYELLQTILSNGLRYGDLNIFHRHETKTGRGHVLFSLSSINKPGTFDLPKMGSYTCPGLTLFMVLRDVADPMLAFDTLLETARQLAEDLGGEVWDDRRQPLNMDKVAQIRSRIREFEASQRTRDFFDTPELESQGE